MKCVDLVVDSEILSILTYSNCSAVPKIEFITTGKDISIIMINMCPDVR